MSIITRVRALEKKLTLREHGETWQDRIDRFKALAAQGIAPEDIRAIARGEWGAVKSPLLIESRQNPVHRARWERIAPVLLQAMQEENAETETNA